MYCPKCNAELRDGSIICNVCGEHFAMEQQKGKFLAAKNKSIAILFDIFHSRMFLVFSIFMSILCGVSFVSMTSGAGLEVALTFAFSLVALIACWGLYSSKSAPEEKKVQKIRWLLKVWRVFSIIAYIAFIIMLVAIILATALLISSWDMVDEVLRSGEIMQKTAEALYNNGFISYEEIETITSTVITTEQILGMFIVSAVVCAIVIAFYIVYSSMLKKSEKYVSCLEDACVSNKYSAEKSPGKFMIVMGIIYAVLYGGSSFSLSLGNFDFSSSTSNLYPLAVGATLICSGILFNKIHAEQIENNANIAHEEAELARIAKLTNEAVFEAKQTTSDEAPNE